MPEKALILSTVSDALLRSESIIHRISNTNE